jgi:hypothetical protein
MGKKFELTISEREQDWSKDNEPLQGDAVTQSEDTPGFGKQAEALQSGGDTPGFGRDAEGPLSPLSD